MSEGKVTTIEFSGSRSYDTIRVVKETHLGKIDI